MEYQLNICQCISGLHNLQLEAVEETLITNKKDPANGELRTILVVEDNHSLRDYLTTILSPHYHVLTAENGQVAWDMLNKKRQTADDGWQTEGEQGAPKPMHDQPSSIDYGLSTMDYRPSAIISDIMMPIMDGYQLLSTIKSSDDFRHIPVIMLTARADLSDKLRALRIGVDDYLLKPFDEEELFTRLENLLINYQERITAVQDFVEEAGPSKSSGPIISQEDQLWLQQLEQHLAENLSNSHYNIAQLADDQAISERQLRRRLKQLTGMSPLHYVKEFRLQKARQLLEQRRYNTIAQTAAAVGYQNTITFSRNFAQHFGKTPSEYMNQ